MMAHLCGVKRAYLLALAAYLAIPALIIAGAGLASLIDPEAARGGADHSPLPGDAWQQFIGKLAIPWRLALELPFFFAAGLLAFELAVLKSELTIAVEATLTGTPATTLSAEQNASSGMWAFAEALKALYLLVVIYLLWPIAFNLARRLITPRR